MAARLVQRLSRLLVASPSFQASSSSIPSECIRACQSAPPRASPLHASALCRHTDSLPALKQKVNGQTEKDFQSLIQSMSSAEELLQISSEYSRSGNRAAAIISQIAKVTETNKAEVVNDRRFAELLSAVNRQVLEYAELLTPLESRTITMALAAQNCRSLPILRALSFHLVQRNKELCPLVIVDLAYAYAKLNFSQHQVLQKMASDLLPKVPELSSKEMTGCIRSFSTLRFFNLPLCEAIAQACLERSSSFTPTQLSSVILSFAHLNFLPSQQEEFFSMVVQRLSEELGSLSPSMLVDLVWSLCVLQLVTPAFLQKALDPQIYKLFMGDVSKKSSNYSLKLTQINATAQLECPEYRGPLLPLSLLSADGGSSLSPLQNDVRNVLRDVFPDKDTCSFNIKTVYGHHIDAEFVLDSENNPLALRNFEDTHVLHSSGTDALPEGARRFALKSWEFSNYCLRTKELTGWFALCRRHLRAAGFLVVEVPFYEWQELKSEWQKSAFLKNQIKKVVAEQMSM
ncbi:FAST kinase domain-containing protein 4 isoform X2 [Bufo gargarizans]|uniref:FAST kinase domain-containing protein 4 isoform X2 n=1 Tax=Bufo gargarizans TaxID=30331 RepID=UPI001CF41E01|nr:FAST kinase domain-containing protein 4 isoform X2 [Bufo gargarizans]